MTTSIYRGDTGLTVLAAVYPTTTTMYDDASGEIIAIPAALADWQAALIAVDEGETAGEANGQYTLTLPEGTDVAGRVVDWFEGATPTPDEVVATDPEPSLSAQDLAAIAAAIRAGTITVRTPVSPDGGTITIVRGDDCLASLNLEIALTEDEAWPDLTGATLSLLAWVRSVDDGATRVLLATGELTATDPQTIQFEPTHTDTLIDPGKYSASVEAAWPSGSQRTLWLGELILLDALTTAD